VLSAFFALSAIFWKNVRGIQEKVRTFAQNLCENGQSSESQHACMIGRVAPDEGKANGLHLGKERALCTRFAPSLSLETF